MARLVAGLGAVLAVALFLATSVAEPAGAPTAHATPSQPAGAGLVKHVAAGSIVLPASVDGVGVGLAVDAKGNLYVGFNCCPAGSNNVAVLDPKGRLLREWKVDDASHGVHEPLVAVGPDGNIYVVPALISDTIYVFTPEGVPVRTLGGGAGISQATDIEVDTRGNVYVTSRAGGAARDDTVVRLDPAGKVTGRFGPLPGHPGGLSNALTGLAVAPDGSIWVTTSPGNAGVTSEFQLVHLSPAGKILPGAPRVDIASNGTLSTGDVDFASGRLYIAGSSHDLALFAISPAGRMLDAITGGQGGAVAVRGDDVYVTGLDTRRRSLRSPQVQESYVGHLESYGVREPRPGDSNMYTWKSGLDSCPEAQEGLLVPLLTFSPQDLQRCDALAFNNFVNPCPRGSVTRPGQVFVGGQQVAASFGVQDFNIHPPVVYSGGVIPAKELRSGSIVVSFTCSKGSTQTVVWEWKGEIALHDPSGVVLDGATGRPVEAASVRLQFSLRRGGPFATPGRSGFTPQVNPQVTGRAGSFGWDVAEGFWRLRITAFGYRPFTSPMYKVPPPVTNLQLKLRQNPAEQARLIDPRAGRVGAVRLGTSPGRAVRGLRVRVAGKRVRGITVLARRFRTAQGIMLGSTAVALLKAYPPSRRAIAQLGKERSVSRYRVGPATFTVKRGRVVAILVGR